VPTLKVGKNQRKIIKTLDKSQTNDLARPQNNRRWVYIKARFLLQTESQQIMSTLFLSGRRAQLVIPIELVVVNYKKT
jgi:hypothetical protein